MVLIIGIVVLLIQSVLVFVIARSIYEASVDSSEHEMDVMVSTIGKSARDFGTQQMELMRGTSKIPELREFLSSKGAAEAATAVILAMSQASHEVNTFYLFDNQGRQVITMSQGKAAKLSDLADREYIKAALAGKEGYSSSPTMSIATGKQIVSVTAPVFDESGKVLGGVGMSYSLDRLIANYVESTRVGETGYPFILSPKGVVVAHPNRDRLMKDISGEPGIGPMLASPKGEGVYLRDGKMRKAVWTRVPDWNWVLGFSMDVDEIEAPAVKQRNFLVLMGFAAILALVGVSLLSLEKIVVKPLKQLEGFASAVAAGNLDSPLSLRLSNEIGKLADSLRTMVGSLKGKIAEADEKTRIANEESTRAATATQEAEEARKAAEMAKTEGMLQAAAQLEGVVEIVTSASEQLSAQIEQSSQGAQEQSKRVGETATAMEEMSSTVLEVAKNASQAAESAENAKSKAEGGEAVVYQVIKGIGDVQEKALGLKTDMTTLGRQAESIGQILNVISDIADQTNLLALNAAIEAARAGEAGRGFAVVADEVRKLAEKTMTATKEVGDAIRDIQNGTKKNIDNVEQAVEKIGAATGLAGKSGDALKEIVALVDVTSEQVRSIATAAEEQSATSEEISRSIEDINRISAETSDGMQQSAQAVAELANQSQVLKGLIENMKGDEAGNATGRPHALPGARKALPAKRG
ncbi:MAG: methyl-accepting chemotaxis protein [Solidesulfovibrio sp.]